jgi:hypothetical protein
VRWQQRASVSARCDGLPALGDCDSLPRRSDLHGRWLHDRGDLPRPGQRRRRSGLRDGDGLPALR